MRTLALALVLTGCSFARAWAVDPAVEALKLKFQPQERILLAIVLGEPSSLRQFAEDAKKPSDAVVAVWRGRIAVGARDYLAASHGTNEKAKTVQEMVEPGEWAALMVSLKMLAEGGITDQAKFKIFVTMIDNANEDLKDGELSEAKKVIRMARPKLTTAISEFLETETGKQALLAGDAERKRRADEELARRKPPASAIPAPAPAVGAPAPTVAASASGAAASASKPKGPLSKPGTSAGALDQARKAELEARASAGLQSQTFDGADLAQNKPLVIPGGGTLASNGVVLEAASSSVPNLIVAPPVPADGDQDMAELRQIKSKVSGGKKWWTAGGGGLLGGLLGLLIAGPIGALVGAGALGGVGYRVGSFLWG